MKKNTNVQMEERKQYVIIDGVLVETIPGEPVDWDFDR